jgi:hypothetical protein
MAFKQEHTAKGWRVYDPDNAAIDVTHRDRASALDAAQATLKECEQAKHAQKAEPERAAKRKRKIKVYDWMLRSKEEEWRLCNREEYETMAERIIAIKARALVLKAEYGFRDHYPIEEYGFKKRFDLADELIGLLRDYRHNKARPPTKDVLKEHRQRLEEIRNTGSLENATLLEAISLEWPREPETDKERRKLKQAARKEQQKKGTPGRYMTDEAKLARGLASTWHLGTGKGLATGGPRDFRGPYARFAYECLKLLDIHVNDSALRKGAGDMRRYFQGRKGQSENAETR